VLQYIFFPARCDIDDVIYGLLGGLLGSLGFFLLNLIFKAFSGKEFLAKDPAYRFSNSSLHF
jgi:glycopeptide antibiotics resistance protein